MKKTAVCLAAVSMLLLFSATLSRATEQKIIFNTESVKYRPGTGALACQDKCSRRSDTDVKTFLSQGWRIVGSKPKEVIAEGYWYTPCNTCDPHGCNCIGTEYVLQKDGPAPKVETPTVEIVAPDRNKKTEQSVPKVEAPNNEVVIPEKNMRTELPPRKVDASNNELELLKKENELLKREIEILKNEIKSKQNNIIDKP